MRRLLLALCGLAIGSALRSGHGDALVRLSAAAAASPPAFTIYFIDVEGGQSTLLVTPDRQALLVDAGFPGFDDRDARRILAAMRDAGVTRLDYLLLTHFHQDHIGGVAAIAQQIPIDVFVDHDTLIDTDRLTVAAFQSYDPVRSGHRQIHPRPGDRLTLKGVDIVVISANGDTLSTELPWAGQANPWCAGFVRQAEDSGENARSIGIWVRYGRFRFLDPGDLNWNKLAQLVCPVNLVGRVETYLVSHHGNADSNLPAFLAAVQPRVAVLNNSITKGGSPDTLAALHGLPGLEGVWQLHRSAREGAENFADEFVANVDDPDAGYWLKLTAAADGSFRIANPRNGFTRSYQPTPISSKP
jgi:beta-lactamase superfamily II metal-dependent hydrolase